MYNSTLEQFEILPFLSFALSKIDHTYLISQAFDLPNSLLSFIFAIFLIILLTIQGLAHAMDLGNKVPISEETKIRIELAIADFRRLYWKGRKGPLTREEIIYLLEVIKFLLEINRQYKFMTPPELAQFKNMKSFTEKALKK